MFHAGTTWTGFRVVLGAYVDARSLAFFQKYTLNPDSTGDSKSFQDHRFTQRSKEVHDHLKETFNGFLKESQASGQPTRPLSDEYRREVQVLQGQYVEYQRSRESDDC